MPYKAKSEKALTVVFSLAAVILFIAGAANYYAYKRAVKTTAIVTHSQSCINLVSETKELLTKAQNAVWGYVLLGFAEYVNDYQKITSDIPSHIDRLQRYTMPHPDQQASMDSIRKKFAELSDLQRSLLNDIGGTCLPHPEQKQQALRLRTDFAAIISELDKIEERETESLERQIYAAEVSAKWAAVAAALVVGAGIIITAAGVIVLRFYVIRRHIYLEQIAENEARLQKFVDSAFEGILLHDHGVIIDASTAFAQMHGYTVEELIGTDALKCVSPQSRNVVLSHIEQESEVPYEATDIRKDGTMFPVIIQARNTIYQGKKMRVVAVRDMTDIKHTEKKLRELNYELTEKNRELESILYVAAHDLRAPIVNIEGFAKELQDSCNRIISDAQTNAIPLDKSTLDEIRSNIPESISFIHTGVSKMASVIEAVLNLSRMGREHLNIEKLDMNALVGDAMKTMEYQLRQAGATVKVEELPPCAGDGASLTRVFINLIDNAIKYRDSERPVMLNVWATEKEGRCVYCVEDNGTGIDPRYKEKIFEIFERLGKSGVSGDGLGLTAAKRILERMHGQIWVESELGKGSKFFVSMPKQI